VVRSLDHLTDLFRVERRRFFTKNVFPGVEALNRKRRVKLVGDDDTDSVRARFVQHFFHGAEDLWDFAFFSGFCRSLGIQIGNCNNLGTRCLETVGVILKHSACPDNCDFCRHIPVLFL
jgi:hypothetical protein